MDKDKIKTLVKKELEISISKIAPLEDPSEKDGKQIKIYRSEKFVGFGSLSEYREHIIKDALELSSKMIEEILIKINNDN